MLLLWKLCTMFAEFLLFSRVDGHYAVSFVVTESMNIYEDFINAKKEKKENIPFSPK